MNSAAASEIAGLGEKVEQEVGVHHLPPFFFPLGLNMSSMRSVTT
jgi:hypothetical protein